MEKKITKRVAVPLDGEHFRETTIELMQVYHDNTKKLEGTQEISRVGGRLLQVAQPGQKPDLQLMNETNFEVLAFVVVSEPPPKAMAAPEPEEKTTKEQEEDMASKKKTKKKAITEVPAASSSVEQLVLEELVDADATKKAPKAVAKKKPKAPKSKDGGNGAGQMTLVGATPSPKKKGTKAVPKKKGTKKKAAPRKAVAAATPKLAPKAPEDGVKAVPRSGQSAPPRNVQKLNTKEQRVLAALSNGASQMSISELVGATPFKKSVGGKKANSWVRNSLRRLVCGGFVKKVGRGLYEATAQGKKFAAEA